MEDRIRLLETQNRWLKLCFVGILSFMLMLTTMGAGANKKKVAEQEAQDAQDEIRAKRIVVVDDDGSERIVLEVAEKKMNSEIKSDRRKDVFATLSMLDSDGVERVSLDTSDSLSRMKLFNDSGIRKIEAVSAKGDFAKLIFYDAKGIKEQAVLP